MSAMVAYFDLMKRFPDDCYAVVVAGRRGPVGNSKKTAMARFIKSGLIASAKEHNSRRSHAAR